MFCELVSAGVIAFIILDFVCLFFKCSFCGKKKICTHNKTNVHTHKKKITGNNAADLARKAGYVELEEFLRDQF